MSTQQAPISAARLVDNVYDRLREAIFAGELPAGTRLRVTQLADQMEVSRSPIREAVLRLTREGLAAEEPRRGVVVASITGSDLMELYQVREVLEGLSAWLATSNADQAFLAELAENVEAHAQAVAAGDVERHYDVDQRFHALISRQARNAVLARSLEDLQGQIRLAMRTTQVSGGPAKAVEDHRRLLDAIRNGDPAAAERVARSHVERVRLRLVGSQPLPEARAMQGQDARARQSPKRRGAEV